MIGIRCLPSHQGSWNNRRIKCGPATREKPCTTTGRPSLFYPNEKGENLKQTSEPASNPSSPTLSSISIYLYGLHHSPPKSQHSHKTKARRHHQTIRHRTLQLHMHACITPHIYMYGSCSMIDII